MSKIEERAETARLANHGYLPGTYKDGYIQGATEQKAIDIDKACEYFADWMRRHNDYAQFAVDGLRKAMEAE